MAKRITEEDVTQAEEAVVAAKKRRGDSRSGKTVDSYYNAADELTKVRRAFREQEVNAGRRTGPVAVEQNTNGEDR